ncbi:MAG: hypothetical protein ACOVKS_00290 [Aquimonas sp.]|jgi:hypothetical protein
MIRARHFPGDDTLAVVEAGTLDELQAATGAPVHIEQPDPTWPFAAIVPADDVRQLLG